MTCSRKRLRRSGFVQLRMALSFIAFTCEMLKSYGGRSSSSNQYRSPVFSL